MSTQYQCSEFRPFDGTPGVCVGCGTALTGRKRVWCSRDCEYRWVNQHYWSAARAAAKRRDGQKCVREGCGATTGLEVNHIEPRVGRGYGWGCWNHLSNLETLCHEHHLAVTAEQRAARKPAPVEPRFAPEPMFEVTP